MSPRDDIPPNMGAQSQTSQRRLPHSEEVEMGLLAALMFDNSAHSAIAEMLKPDHFAIVLHRQIYTAITMLLNDGEKADAAIVKHIMARSPELKEAGGFEYLRKIMESAPPASFVPSYAKIIYDSYLRRELIARATEIVDDAYDRDSEIDALQQILVAEERLSRVSALAAGATGGSSGPKSMEQIGLEFIDRIDAAAKAQRGEVMGVPTGIRELDERLTGLKGGQVTLIAARPGMGKSVLSLGIARYATTKQTASEPGELPRDRTALLWIGEMSRVDLYQRIAAAEKGIPVSAQTSSGLDGPRADELIEWAMQMQNQGLYIDDTPFITLAKLRRSALELKRRRGHLDLIVIDYLNQMTVENLPAGPQEHQRISIISRGLTQLAKEFDCPVIAVTQLSRGVEMREDKRPMLSDLRESGSLEQDATNVLLLYRPEYYLQNDPEQGPRESTESFANRSATHTRLRAAAANKVEIICAKVRQGQTGTVLAHWDGPRMRISDPQGPSAPPQRSMYYGDGDGF